MSKPSFQERCRADLTRRALADPFLATRDQRPEMERLLAELDATLADNHRRSYEEFAPIIQDVHAATEAVSQTLGEVRERLVLAFEPLHAATDPAAFRHVIQTLEKQSRLLAQRLRPRLLRVLDKAAPRHKHLERTFSEHAKVRLDTVDGLPDELILVMAVRHGVTFEPGRTVFAIACEAELDSVCRTRFLARGRYRRLRRRARLTYHLLRVPFQDMARDALIVRSNLTLATMERRHETTHAELLTRLNDSWRALRYNFETAAMEFADLGEKLAVGETGEIGEKSKELESMVLGALDRARETLESVAATYQTLLDAFHAEFSADDRNGIAAIQRGVASADHLRGRLRWALRSLQKAALRRWGVYVRLAGEKTGAAKILMNREAGRAQHWWLAVKDFLGISAPVTETMLQLTDLPTRADVQKRSRALPPIYRRLFSPESLNNREFMVGHEEDSKRLADSLARWQAGRAACVMLAGPDGSGKTSVLNSFEADLDPQILVTRLELERRVRHSTELVALLEQALELPQGSESVDQLIEQLLATPRRVIILEKSHQLMLRTVGGREAVEAMLYIIMTTRTHLLWVLSSRLYAWKRMEYLLGARQYFTHVIETGFLDREALREALMLRQRATGQELLFNDEGADVARVRTLRRSHALESTVVQEALADRFFSVLYAMSGGSVTAALFYWLHAQHLDRTGRILVNPCARFDDRFIKDLDRPYLFTLAEILCHGTLTPEEHGEIFRTPSLRSRLMLDYLCEISLVEMHEVDGKPSHYGINPVFYSPVARNLSNLNILY
jgi:hypothetical protein